MRRLLTVLVLLVVALSVVGVVFQVHGPTTHHDAAEVTLPFSHGSSFTLLRTVSIMLGNETAVIEESEEVFIVVEPGFPLTRVRLLSGVEKYLPTVFLAVPLELYSSDFYAPVEAKLVNEALCIQLQPRGTRHSGGTPGTCKSVFVEVRYDERGLTQQTMLYAGIGGAVYIERTYVVARSVSGEIRVKVEPVCTTLYSSSILYATPGLYYFDEKGGRYIVDREYDKYRPLLIVLKTPENQELWRTLPGRYRGYVLLVSPLLADLDKVPGLERLQTEKVIYLD